MDISKKLNCAYDDVIAVGDGANDLGMLTKAGMGVALHAKPIVAAQCKARLNFANLEGLLICKVIQSKKSFKLNNSALI